MKPMDFRRQWRRRHWPGSSSSKWPRMTTGQTILTTALLLFWCSSGDLADAFVLRSLIAPGSLTLKQRRTPVTPPFRQTQLRPLWVRWSLSHDTTAKATTGAAAALWHGNNHEPSVIATAIVAGSVCLGLQLVLQTVLYYFSMNRKQSSSRDNINNNNFDTDITTNGGSSGTVVQRSSNNNNASNKQKDARTRHQLFSTAVRQAHSKVALLLMTTVSIWGCWGWFGSAAPTTAAARIWGENTSVAKLAAVIGGSMVLWDIPMALWSLVWLHIPSLSSLVMLFHHVVMAAVAYVGATALPTHYGFFYLGVSELSSIPLVLYDELVERHKEQENLKTLSKKQIPIQLMNGFKVVTALAFVLVRVLYFTKITVGHFCPDVLKLLRGGDFSSAKVLWFMLTTSLGFTVLQLYWFYANILSVLLPPAPRWNNGRAEPLTTKETTTTTPTTPATE